MSLRARLTALCLAFLALAAGASAFGSVLVLRANDARRDHQKLERAAQTAQDLESAYVGQAASIRAYFLSGESKSLDEYNAQRFDAGDANGAIRGYLLDTPLLARVDDVTEAARTWRDSAILPLITLQQQKGVSQEVITQYRDGPAVESFQKLADSLRMLRARITTAEASAGRTERQTRDRVGQFAIACVVAALASLLVMRLIARFWIGRPITQLTQALRSSDDGARRLRGGPTEIKQLSAAVEALRVTSRDEVELAKRTREGLTQNAAVLMSLRAQLETSPDTLPPDWSVSAQLQPATGIVAGDCYHVDSLGRDVATVVVVDVAGHGATSAVMALRAKELLRAAIRSYTDPSDAIAWASAQLSDPNSDMFVTAFVARIDLTSGLVRYVNAGHPEALICDGVNAAELGVTGPLIGPFAGEWQTREAILGHGQMLVVYTDGLIEVRNEKREEFGLDRLRNVLRDNYGDDTDSVVKQCLAEVDAFGNGRAHDDVTIAVIARAMAN